jgi:cystathionine beta-lyase
LIFLDLRNELWRAGMRAGEERPAPTALHRKDQTMKTETRIVESGRDPKAQQGAMNTPVYHASTVAFPTVEAFEAAKRNRNNVFFYGRYGTPTTHALETAVAELEGAGRSIAAGTGLGAISTALLSYLSAGDHLLVADNVYAPLRACCDGFFKRIGIETTYYDPMTPEAWNALVRPTTKVVYAEAPGSLTFEVPDLTAIVAFARKHRLKSVLDNTWATPYFLRPLELGFDVTIIAGTKYIGGHADLMMGFLTVPEVDFDMVRATANVLGNTPGPDDCYLALRGLRTLAVRLRRHEETALRLATWLADRPEVDRVLHPALEESRGHDNWKRLFGGSTGLFGVVLKPCSDAAVAAMIDNRRLFSIGVSWGGYESLMTYEHPDRVRTVVPWRAHGPLLRIHAGLEDPDDLIDDLSDGLARLAGAMK